MLTPRGALVTVTRDSDDAAEAELVAVTPAG